MTERNLTPGEMFAELMKDPANRAAGNAEGFKFDLVQALMRKFEIARADRGLTKADLAKVTSVSPVTVRRILTDPGANPRLTTLFELAEALDCDLVLVPREGADRVKANTR